MYTWKEFPKSRHLEIREECGCNYAHQTRMELMDLFDDAKDQSDIEYIFSMLDETDQLVEACRAKARAQLKAEVEAWNEKEKANSDAEYEAWRSEWRAKMQKATEEFMKWLNN